MTTANWKRFESSGVPAMDYWQSGTGQGPQVLITACVHGDEYEGPAAVLELTKRLEGMSIAGTVVAIPIVNPLAFEAGTRLTPEDGLNLARTFPGKPDGSVTERLAAAVFEKFARPSQFLIDFHSGGVEYLFVPLAGFYGSGRAGNPSYEAAVRFGLPVQWQLPETRGVLSCEASLLGKVAVGHEYLGAGQLSAEGVERYVEGTLSCLRYWGLLDDQPPMSPAPAVFTGDWELAGGDGLFLCHRALGDCVRQGELVAEIQPVPGKSIPLISRFAGKLLGVRSKAWIRKGNWAIFVGNPEGKLVV